MLVNPFESEQQGATVKVCVYVCVSVCVHMWPWLLRIEIVEIGGGQRKQDANESVLINVCLISYSALSGQGEGEDGGAEGAVRDCWVEFMRKCRPNL